MARRAQSPQAPEELFGSLFRAEADRLLIWFARRTLDTEVAMDLMAETFAQAFAGRQRLRGDQHDAVRWLYGIASHQLSRFHRKGRAETRMLHRLGLEREQLQAPEQERLEHLAELDQSRAKVAAALESVASDQREAIRLRVIEEMPYPEMAQRLQVSEQTARARVSRGLRGLASLLGDSTPAKPTEVIA